MRLAAARSLIVLAVVGALSSDAEALVIEYQAIDLADVVAGEDLWQYRYSVSDYVFAADQGFSVGFDPTRYSDIEDPPPFVNADWSLLILQPDPVLPDDGLYDALALVGAPSLLNEFVVNFVWHGAAGPASQPWTLNQFDTAGNLAAVLAQGRTIPIGQPVPEPSTLWLIAVAAGGAARKRFP